MRVTRRRAGSSSGVPLNQNASKIRIKVYRWELRRFEHVQNTVNIRTMPIKMEYALHI